MNVTDRTLAYLNHNSEPKLVQHWNWQRCYAAQFSLIVSAQLHPAADRPQSFLSLHRS